MVMQRPFQESVFSIVARRASYRTYMASPEETPRLTALAAALASLPGAPFGTPVRVVLVRDFDPEKHGVRKLGTYGVIRGAKNFLVGILGRGPHGFEDLGYVFEWAILKATELGLQTCWVGGTLDRGAFATAAGAGPDETVPAVSPVGVATARRSLVDRAFRFLAASKDRKPHGELFFSRNFATPFSLASGSPFVRALELVRLAPSASNRQPWRVLHDPEGKAFHFFLRRTPGYDRLTAVDLQRIDMGIAMCHFEVGCRELGIEGTWTRETPSHLHAPPALEHVATFRLAPGQ